MINLGVFALFLAGCAGDGGKVSAAPEKFSANPGEVNCYEARKEHYLSVCYYQNGVDQGIVTEEEKAEWITIIEDEFKNEYPTCEL